MPAPKAETDTKFALFLEGRHKLGLNMTQAAKHAGVCRATAYKYQDKEEYRRVALAYLNDNDGVKETMETAFDMLHADKIVFVAGKPVSVPDNKSRLDAVKIIKEILGLDAPREQNINVGIAGRSDDAIAGEIANATTQFCHGAKLVSAKILTEMARGQRDLSNGIDIAEQGALLPDNTLPQEGQ